MTTTAYDAPPAIRARRDVATAMSRQAYRLERQLGTIRRGAEARLGNERAGLVVWQIATKLAEFGHLIVEGHRQSRYAPAAALVRTLIEDTTLLAWIGAHDDPDQQRARAIRVALVVYRDARDRGYDLPPDAEQLLTQATGPAAKKPPSLGDRARQLDAKERSGPDGKEHWVSHLAHAEMLSDIVHPGFLGPDFTDPMTRELLGFDAIAYGHQYLALGAVAAARLSDQKALERRVLVAYSRIHATQTQELQRLIK